MRKTAAWVKIIKYKFVPESKPSLLYCVMPANSQEWKFILGKSSDYEILENEWRRQ